MLKLELPVILVSGSGGLADLIIEAIETSGDEKRIQGHVNEFILIDKVFHLKIRIS